MLAFSSTQNRDRHLADVWRKRPVLPLRERPHHRRADPTEQYLLQHGSNFLYLSTLSAVAPTKGNESRPRRFAAR